MSTKNRREDLGMPTLVEVIADRKIQHLGRVTRDIIDDIRDVPEPRPSRTAEQNRGTGIYALAGLMLLTAGTVKVADTYFDFIDRNSDQVEQPFDDCDVKGENAEANGATAAAANTIVNICLDAASAKP